MPYGATKSPGNTVTGYYMRKLLDETNRDFVLNGSYQPWPEFRYAELELIKAECLARAGKYAEARTVINDLRVKRFGRDDVYTAPISSWDTALDVILHERMIELCYEGHRFWDLRRTGRAHTVLDGKKYTGVLWKKALDGSFTPSSVAADVAAHRYPTGSLSRRVRLRIIQRLVKTVIGSGYEKDSIIYDGGFRAAFLREAGREGA